MSDTLAAFDDYPARCRLGANLLSAFERVAKRPSVAVNRYGVDRNALDAMLARRAFLQFLDAKDGEPHVFLECSDAAADVA